MGTLKRKKQIKEKLKLGFTCIKMKIGAIDFNKEIGLLKSIRKEFSKSEIELRVDANGAFTPKNALEKFAQLAKLQLHSIEQPIKQGQLEEMAILCEKTPLPIALDEELIGVFSSEKKQKVIETIKPQYIILKPSLVGGFAGSLEWINLANQNNTIRESLSRKYESHGIGPSSLPIERQSTNLNNDYSSPNIMDRTVPV